MKTILADTSSLILLNRCDAIALFTDIYSIVIPDAVYNELTCPEYDDSAFFRLLTDTNRINVIKTSHDETSRIPKLHAGEQQLIRLYQEGKGNFVMIDDREGCAYCRKNSIPYINALLGIKLIYLTGGIGEKKYQQLKLQLLSKARYSKQITAWAETSGRDTLKFFLPHNYFSP